MGDKKENSSSEKPHPTIIGTEEKEIKNLKPPNDKIVDFSIAKSKSDKED